MRRAGIIRLCIWAVIAAVLISLFVLLFTGHLQMPNVTNWSFGMTGTYYQDSHLYQAGNTELSAPVNALDIEWISGSVTVEPWDGETITVYDGNTDDNDDMKLHWYLDEKKTLHIRYGASKTHIGLVNWGRKDLTVRIPTSWIEACREMEIETASADVSLRGATLQSLDIITASGEITLSGTQAETAQIESVSGAIQATALAADRISLNTVSGDAALNGSLAHMDIETVSGKITVTTDCFVHTLDAESVSGDIHLTCPQGDGFILEFDTASGSVLCDYAMTKKNGKFLCGGEAAEWDVETVSGDFYIKKP